MQEPIEYLLITNTLHPYQVHNISVLSLPPGATYRFRYEASHLLLDRKQIEELPGKFGLLVLRNFDRGTFMPLRTFRYFRSEYCGDLVFLELEFLSYVKYNQLNPSFEVTEQDSLERQNLAGAGATWVHAELERYSKDISNAIAPHGIDNRPGDRLKKLVMQVNPGELRAIPLDDRTDEAISIGLWARIVSLLGWLPSYGEACFYLIGSVRDVDSGKTAVAFASKWRRGLQLRAGRGYTLPVYQIMANRRAPAPPGFLMKLNHIEKYVLPLRTCEAVDGAYDRLDFYFYVLPQERRRNQSLLVVQCDQKISNGTTGGEKESIELPPSLLQVRIDWTRWDFIRRRLLPPPLFVLGILAFIFSNAASAWAGHGITPQYVQLLGLALLAAAARSWEFLTGAFRPGEGTKT